MLSALTGPALVFITGLAVPLGWLVAPEVMNYAHMLGFARHILGKLSILSVIVLYLWHAAHRIYKSLHDIGIPPGPASRAACYGSAMVGSLLAVYGVLAVGF